MTSRHWAAICGTRKSPDTSLAELVARVRALPNIQVLQGCYCFGLYEGNLLGIVRPRKDPKDAERLIHLRARPSSGGHGRLRISAAFSQQ